MLCFPLRTDNLDSNANAHANGKISLVNLEDIHAAKDDFTKTTAEGTRLSVFHSRDEVSGDKLVHWGSFQAILQRII